MCPPVQRVYTLPWIAHKHDVEAARALVALGPRAAPRAWHMLGWCQDVNWPVARVLLEVFGEEAVADALVAPIRAVLRGQDTMWMWWCLDMVVEGWPPERLARLRPELERLAHDPTPAMRTDEVDQAAAHRLATLHTAR